MNNKQTTLADARIYRFNLNPVFSTTRNWFEERVTRSDSPVFKTMQICNMEKCIMNTYII